MTFPAWPDGSADALEQELLSRWEQEGLFARTQEQTREGEPFVFYEGPPTANGRPGIHHVFSRTIKDLFCRFRAMQGRSVTRIAGWDTHGLPVEIEVEKELQLNGKKAIEEYGVAAFNAKARASVFRYQSDWETLSNRIGYWLDYEKPYVTCSNEYIESVWWLLKRLHEKALLVRGHRVLPYCPRCGTVLSSHELALGYEEVKDKSVYVTFPLADGSGRELVVWTTTPWTLPSNVAVAVHPDLEYGEYRFGDRVLVAAVARAAALIVDDHGLEGKKGPTHLADLPLVRTLRGAELAGLSYHRPLDVVPLPADKRSQVVVTGEFVTADDGSGMVHMAPAFGADDYEAGKQHDLALLRPVAADGTFVGTTWPALEGKLVTADETNELIIRRLKELGRWLRTEQYVHSYPHCWRCRSKLIYMARDSWFVRTSAVKARMLELNDRVAWHPPEVGTGRFGEWLANNVDWALSRDRYWGTPLPVWVSDRDPSHVEVIGSYAELAEKVGRALPEPFDPHKPFIDEYTWPAPGGGTMRRAPEVIDTWFDSGAMPYAQWHYPFEHQEAFDAHFPADFICEGVDQTRGWFYSLLAIAVTVFDSVAYRNVVVNELVLDADGQKMSKSRGNVADPWQAIRDYGADTVRLYLLASSQVWLPRRFDPKGIAEQGAFLNTLRQTYRFFSLYAGDWSPNARADAPHTALDRWILARLDRLVEEVTRAWEGYEPTEGVRLLVQFVVDDLSNWYVRLSRSRFWAPGKAADPAAVATLHEALATVARLLAPAAPFASDWLHRALAERSVHLAGFPGSRGRRDPALEDAMDTVRRLASLARAAREAGNLRVRQPLGRLQVAVPPRVRGPVLDSLLELLRSEVNVRDITQVASDTDLVRLKAKPNFRALGRKFGKRTPEAAAACALLSPDALRTLEAGGRVMLDGFGELVHDDVVVEREVTSDWLVQSDGPLVVALDPHVTDELRGEGIAREVVNRVQRMRKEAGYEYTTRIRLWVSGEPVLQRAVEAHAAFVQEETLARAIGVGERATAPDIEQEVDVDGLVGLVGIRREGAD
ncbi:MAG: isoleucine--tRNA ligase [Gemmatimonadales bacterium]